MVRNQVTLTLYPLPKRDWRGKVIWFYFFHAHGMWGLSFRVLWLGFDFHNNSVWAFEDDTVRKARALT